MDYDKKTSKYLCIYIGYFYFPGHELAKICYEFLLLPVQLLINDMYFTVICIFKENIILNFVNYLNVCFRTCFRNPDFKNFLLVSANDFFFTDARSRRMVQSILRSRGVAIAENFGVPHHI